MNSTNPDKPLFCLRPGKIVEFDFKNYQITSTRLSEKWASQSVAPIFVSTEEFIGSTFFEQPEKSFVMTAEELVL